MTSTQKSIVMGVAAGYTNDVIRPFVKSLKRTDYRGRICLFVGNVAEPDLRELRAMVDDVVVLDGAYGAEIARRRLAPWVAKLKKIRVTPRIRRLYPGLFRMTAGAAGRDRLALRLDLEQALEGFQSLRYHQYLAYLESAGRDADFVMISDIRDVIFQSDPFAHEFENDLELFLETDALLIENDPFNGRWIKDLYGPRVLQEIGRHTVSCSGTTLGTRTGMLRYLRSMIAEVERHCFPLGSHDQGIHNYLLRTGKLGESTVYRNGQAPVLTLGAEKRVQEDGKGRLLNHDGAIAPVVHQYDRHVGLANRIWSALQ